MQTLNRLFTRQCLTADECSELARKKKEWEDHLAEVLLTKPAEVVTEACRVLEQHDCPVKELNMLSELYQNKLVTEDEVQMMNNQDRHLSDSVLIFQCTKPPEVVARSAIVLDKYTYNDAARQLRVLNELFTRQHLTAEECFEMARKGRQEWEEHLCHVLLTKPAVVVEEACPMLEEHGCCLKELKMLSELYQEMLVTEDDVNRMNVEEGEISDRLVLVQCTKSSTVNRTADVLDKYGHKEEASLLRVLNELFTRHHLTAEECFEMSKKGRQGWEDHLTQVLQSKPAMVVQESCHVLEEHGCPVKIELEVLSDLYQEKLVTEDEVKRIAGEFLLYRLVRVQCTKPPEDASRTADVFDKYGHNEEARRLRVLSELYQEKLVTEDEGKVMKGGGAVPVLSIKPSEVVTKIANVLDKYGRNLEATKLRALNELLTRRLLTKRECFEMDKQWRWKDHLAIVISIKSAEVMQKSFLVLEKHGYKVEEQVKMLLELYQEKLVTEDELKRMKTGENLCQRLVFVQSTKHQGVVIRTVHVMDKFGHNEGAKQLRVLNELFTKQLLKAEECSEIAKTGCRWESHLIRVLSTKLAEVVQEACRVLEKHGCPVKELKMLSELYQEKLVTEEDVKRMKGEGRYLFDRVGLILFTKPPELVTRIAFVLDKWGFNKEAWQLRGMRQGHFVVTSGPRYGSSVFSFDSGYGSSTISAPSTISTSHQLEHSVEVSLHPHEEPSLRLKKPSSEEVKEGSTSQGSKVIPHPAGGGSGPPKEPDIAEVKTAETTLNDLCWIPFGTQSQSVGPEGGKLSLEPLAGAMGEEEQGAILLEVPPGAVNQSGSVEVHSALIPDGPFTLPKGYQLGSSVVYIYYDSRRVSRPLILRLPHWYGGENQVRDGLSFAVAPHTLKDGESVYHFELLEGGKMLSSHCMELEIDGHCSLFAEVFKKGAGLRYQAISLQREKENEMACDVAITYAFPLWCDILMKYRGDWEVNKHSYPFTFEDCKVKGKLRDEHGNGWHAAINGPSELKPDDVEYVNHGITTPKLLEKAVLSKGYPPAISCVFVYREELKKTGRPVLVSLDVTGAGKELTFMCKTYEEADDQQLDRSRNAAAAAASQSLMTLPPNMMATTPQAETDSGAPTPLPPPPPPPPDTADIVEALNHQLDAKWRHFGTFLRVDYQTMEAIRLDNGGRPDDCMLDLLGRWTSNQAGTGALPRTWQTVVEAVRKTGFGAIAENLAHKYGLTPSQ